MSGLTVLQGGGLTAFIIANVTQSLRLTGQNAAGSFILPAGGLIDIIRVKNTTANAITGGLKFGTTSGATDVVVALAVAGSSVVTITDAALLLKSFSDTVTQQIFYDAVVAWNSASVQIDVIYFQL